MGFLRQTLAHGYVLIGHLFFDATLIFVNTRSTGVFPNTQKPPYVQVLYRYVTIFFLFFFWGGAFSAFDVSLTACSMLPSILMLHVANLTRV